MPVGDLLSGLVQGFSEGRLRQSEKKDRDQERKLRTKLFELSLKKHDLDVAKAAREAETFSQQQGALDQIMQAAQGKQQITREGMPPIEGESGRSFLDMATDEQMAPMLLQAGLADFPDLVEMQRKGQGLGGTITPEKLAELGGLGLEVSGATLDDDGLKLTFADASSGMESAKGKEMADLELLAEKFGADSPQVRLFQQEAFPGIGAEPPDFSEIGATRREFTKLSEPNAIAIASFDRMLGAVENPTGAGDVAIVFQFMKLLDPGSRVTEGEVILASQVSGRASQFLNLYSRLIKGERLTPAARIDLVTQAGNIARDTVGKQRAQEKRFSEIAKRNRVLPEDVVLDFVGDTEAAIEGLGEPTGPLAKSITAAEQSLSTKLKGAIEDVPQSLEEIESADPTRQSDTWIENALKFLEGLKQDGR